MGCLRCINCAALDRLWQGGVMLLTKVLQSQGFGSRKECHRLIESGAVELRGVVCDDPKADVDVQGLEFRVDGEPYTYRERVMVLLHKPLGFECSHRPQRHASVFELLPAQLLARGVQAVGRLDEDTSGLLLLTDDGALVHALTSPRRHVPKRYVATLAGVLAPEAVARLLAGVTLTGDPDPARALELRLVGPAEVEVVIDEGRYHQVRRMFGAVGNAVTALRRTALGSLTLPPDLGPGQWRYLEEAEVEALTTR